MSDYKLNKTERIDVEEVLKDLEHYHPRRRGWTWRQPAPAAQLQQGPFQYRDISANMEGESVGLMTAHYFDNIDPQPMPTITVIYAHYVKNGSSAGISVIFKYAIVQGH